MDREKVEKLISEVVNLSDKSIIARVGLFDRDFSTIEEIFYRCNLMERELGVDQRYGYVSEQLVWIRTALRSAQRKNAEPRVASDLSSAVLRLTSAWNRTKRWQEYGGLHLDEGDK